MRNSNTNNSNIITNSSISKNVNQVQNNYAKREVKENHFSLFEAFRLIEELKREVSQLKEQIKNKNS